MKSLTRYAPDGKIVVAVVAAAYVTALLFAFAPSVSPGAIAARVTGK